MHKSLFSHFFETECGGHSNEVPEGLALIKQHVNCQIYSKKICELRYFLQKDGWWATYLSVLSFCTSWFFRGISNFQKKNFSNAQQSNPAALALDAG